MTKEKIFFIAYEVCKFINERETQHLENYELCIAVSNLAVDIETAMDTEKYEILNPYFQRLETELEECAEVYKKETQEIIELLTEVIQ